MDKKTVLEAGVRAIQEAAPDFAPDLAIILGSGLGSLADRVEKVAVLPYDQIPGFKPSTAPYHAGRLILGRLAGKNVAVMQGRLHYYEGYTMSEVTDPIRIIALWGVKRIILTNAAGGVNQTFARGDLMLITDHIKLFTESPARGKENHLFGPRFFDMTETYSVSMGHVLRKAARKQGIHLREGVYMFFPGPQYETPAEIRMARVLGADAVGMSTVPEAIVARQMGLKTLGVSLISNLAAGMPGQTQITEEEVAETGAAAAERFCALIETAVELLPPAGTEE